MNRLGSSFAGALLLGVGLIAAAGCDPGRSQAAPPLPAKGAGGGLPIEAIPPGDLTPRRLRELAASGSEQVLRRLEEVWGRVSLQATGEMEALRQRILDIARTGSGRSEQGVLVFEKLCAKCHELRGKGRHVGPPLDQALGGDLGEIVTAIVNPNELVRREYFATGVLLDDGRFPQGILVSRDRHRVILRREEGVEESFPAFKVRQIIPAGVSYMPEGLLNDLKEDEIRGLLAYLVEAPQ